jgi:hypothetical protein
MKMVKYKGYSDSSIPRIKIINQLPYFRHQLKKVTEVNIVNDFALQKKICKQSHYENSISRTIHQKINKGREGKPSGPNDQKKQVHKGHHKQPHLAEL